MSKQKTGTKREDRTSAGVNSNVSRATLTAMRRLRPAGDRVLNVLAARLAGKNTVEVVPTGDPARPFRRETVNGKADVERRRREQFRIRHTD